MPDTDGNQNKRVRVQVFGSYREMALLSQNLFCDVDLVVTCCVGFVELDNSKYRVILKFFVLGSLLTIKIYPKLINVY